MLKRVVIGAAVAAMLGGAACAEPANEEDCMQQLLDAESAAADQTLSDEDRTKVDELLDQLEAQCSASEFPQAAETIGSIHKILGH